MRIGRTLGLAMAAASMGAIAFAGSATATTPMVSEPAPITALGPCNYSGAHPTIQQGSRGEAVAHAQCLLRNVRGHLTVVVDGVFGPVTRSAVIAEQRRCRIAQDGIIGPNTWRCLHP